MLSSFSSSPKKLLSFTQTDSWAKLLCQASKSCCCWVMQSKRNRLGFVAMHAPEVKVCVCEWVWVLLATLHVMATDPKVTDHPSCVFTHFIIDLTDQQWLDCSYRAQCLDGYQYTVFLPSQCRTLPLGLDTLLSTALWFLNHSCEDQTFFPMCEEGLQQSRWSSSTFS